MSLPQIILLLQALISLLGNPQAATNPQVQTLAQQAIVIATEALQNQTTSVGIVSPLPVDYVIPSVPTTTITLPSQQTTTISIGAPDLGSIATPAVSPSCSVSFQAAPNAQGTLSWSVENPSQPLNVTLSDTATKSVYDPGSGQWTYTWQPTSESVSVPSKYQTAIVQNAPQLDFGSPITSPYWEYNVGINNSAPVRINLSIGGATCTTEVAAQ